MQKKLDPIKRNFQIKTPSSLIKCENPIVSPDSVFMDNLSDEYSASTMNPTSYIKLQFNKQFIILSYFLTINNASNTSKIKSFVNPYR